MKQKRHMKKFLELIALTALIVAASGCSKSYAEQMAMADKVVVECTPAVLEAAGGQIPATITVTYPADYFHPEALMVVTPVLVYEGGEQTGESAIYQGESIKDNNRVVYKAGGTVTQKVNFRYLPGCEKCHLELRSVAFYGEKRIEIPTKKVADGCNCTSLLADVSGAYQYKKDEYQYILHQSAEGQILYDVNSAEVKRSQMRSQSIEELQYALAEMMGDDRITVTGTQVVAYASPEGGEDLNAKLSDKRASSAQKAWDELSKGMESDEVQVKSVGQDWEGFQDAVSKSDIEDKELILRVLSMYSDPAVRESEIRNMSQIYTEINQKVFPALRRARFVTSYDFRNWSDEELEELSHKAVNALDEEGLLHVAAGTQDGDRKRQLYTLAAQKFGSQRAIYNLGMLNLDDGIPTAAENWLEQVENPDADVINARGVVAMQRGNYDEALELFRKSGTADAKANMGTLDILKGNYSEAAANLAGYNSENEALALILAGQEGKASEVLGKLDSAKADYLRAIVAARKGDVSAAKAAISAAGEKDPSLKERAAKDIEFVNCR